MSLARSRYHVVLPTYHRNEQLAQTLRAILGQVSPPARIVVVDNAGSQRCRQLCADAPTPPDNPILYVSPGSNLGPAGGTAIGMSHLLQTAADADWILRCDDDSPPPDAHILGDLHDEAVALRRRDHTVAGLGTGGSRFDYRRCRLVKPPAAPPGGLVDVDYLSTNRFPFYSVATIRQVGLFREEFFFGLEEVEFGLRLRRHGYRLCRKDLPEQHRHPSRTSWRLGDPDWRRYYSMRNIVVIAREYGGGLTALRVMFIRGLGKPLLNLPIEPRPAIRHLRLNALAFSHAYRGKLGRTMDPTLKSGGQLGTRRGTWER